MASRTHSVSLTISLLLLSISATSGSAASFAKTTADHANKAEKLTHLRLYFHDIVSGTHPTAAIIVKALPAPTNSSNPTAFGTVYMMDDPLTESPELSSTLVGRAQGLYALDSQHGLGLLMTMNFAFLHGHFNGSTLSILGRNRAADAVREMPIVGGSGLFRFARGYAQARTHTFDPNTGDAIVEYNCFVLHF